MNDIVSPKVLVVAGSRPKQFDDHILPAMNGLGLTVVRVVSPTYRGSLEDIDAVLLMFQFCGREQYTALRSQCNTAKVKFIILPQQTAGWLTTFAEHGLRVPGKPVYARPLPVPPTPIVHPKAEACEAQEPEEVGNEPVVRNLKDWCFLILVDSHNDFRVFHTRQMLNGPGDANGYI